MKRTGKTTEMGSRSWLPGTEGGGWGVTAHGDRFLLKAVKVLEFDRGCGCTKLLVSRSLFLLGPC